MNLTHSCMCLLPCLFSPVVSTASFSRFYPNTVLGLCTQLWDNGEVMEMANSGIIIAAWQEAKRSQITIKNRPDWTRTWLKTKAFGIFVKDVNYFILAFFSLTEGWHKVGGNLKHINLKKRRLWKEKIRIVLIFYSWLAVRVKNLQFSKQYFTDCFLPNVLKILL